MAGELRNRSKEVIQEDVERLKEWLNKQPHLPHNVEPELLSAFVHGTKSLEIAKKKLDGYYTVRNRALGMFDFKHRDPTSERFLKLCKVSKHFILPKTTSNGCRVFIMMVKKENLDIFDHPHFLNKLMMLMELALLRWPDVPGWYAVMDMKDIPASIGTKMNPSAIASFISYYQEGFPVKIKGIYVTNASSFVEFLFNNMFKPFMKEKILKRVKITTQDISAFCDSIPQEILPSDFGDGNEKTTAELNEYWLNQMIEHRSWFEHTSKQMSDETKRPPDGSNTYGMEGTFRKLAVD